VGAALGGKVGGTPERRGTRTQPTVPTEEEEMGKRRVLSDPTSGDGAVFRVHLAGANHMRLAEPTEPQDMVH